MIVQLYEMKQDKIYNIVSGSGDALQYSEICLTNQRYFNNTYIVMLKLKIIDVYLTISSLPSIPFHESPLPIFSTLLLAS